MALRVAFAGHNDLEALGDLDALSAGIRRALSRLPAREMVLVTGLAPGADRLAVQAFADCGGRVVHGVLPFLNEALPDLPAGIELRTTWLDGARSEAGGRNPHALQVRWMLEDADLLVAVWAGAEARGPGGTADAVRLALHRGIPVLWVRPGGLAEPLLISPDAMDPEFGFLDFLERLPGAQPPLVQAATPELIQAIVAEGGAYTALPATRPPLPVRVVEAVLDHTVWRLFQLYCRVVGGRRVLKGAPPPPPAPPPEALAAEPAFRSITAEYEAADRRATRLAAVHRSQQVFQASIMIVAVAVGSSPAVWPQIKLQAVSVELFLAMMTFVVWWTAVASGRSRRWGQARRLAEHLRLERAAWCIGLSARQDGEDGSGAAQAFCVDWRRQYGAATGAFDPERVARRGAWAMGSLLHDQIAYHRRSSALNARLSERGRHMEHLLFWLFVTTLAVFLGASLAGQRFGLHIPHWVGALLIMGGAIAPAFGAASLALESALGFADHARRSAHLERRLQAIADSLPSEPLLEDYQRAARAAILLHLGQEDTWSEEAAHRHVVRGG